MNLLRTVTVSSAFFLLMSFIQNPCSQNLLVKELLITFSHFTDVENMYLKGQVICFGSHSFFEAFLGIGMRLWFECGVFCHTSLNHLSQDGALSIWLNHSDYMTRDRTFLENFLISQLYYFLGVHSILEIFF